jgi:ribosomal protein S24E
MRFKIIEEKENPVLKRKEMIASIDYQQGSTPSKADLQKAISEQLNANIENIEINKILSDVGRPIGMAWIKVWSEKKVPIYKTKKAETKEEKPAEEPKQEAPKEEKKEEPKQEEPQQEAKPEGEQ